MLADPDDQVTPVPGATPSEEVAQGIISNLSKGPIWYASEGVAERSEHFRSMPRNEAVRAALEQANPVMNTKNDT
jgi:hypothetical protein